MIFVVIYYYRFALHTGLFIVNYGYILNLDACTVVLQAKLNLPTTLSECSKKPTLVPMLVISLYPFCDQHPHCSVTAGSTHIWWSSRTLTFHSFLCSSECLRHLISSVPFSILSCMVVDKHSIISNTKTKEWWSFIVISTRVLYSAL